jgi:hypothetical protein
MHRTFADRVGKCLEAENSLAWAQHIENYHDDFASHITCRRPISPEIIIHVLSGSTPIGSAYGKAQRPLKLGIARTKIMYPERYRKPKSCRGG